MSGPNIHVGYRRQRVYCATCAFAISEQGKVIAIYESEPVDGDCEQCGLPLARTGMEIPAPPPLDTRRDDGYYPYFGSSG